MSRVAVVAAGGTGGHMFPAQALAEALARRGWRIVLATDDRGALYASEFPAEKRLALSAATYRNGDVFGMARAGWNIWQGVRQAKAAFRVTPPNEPEMVAAVWLETADVVTVNVLLTAPALTVTLAGTDAAAELSDSVTTAPPAGAGALSDTVPVDDVPPVTVVGLTVSAVRVADCDGVTPSAAKSVVSPRVATSCAVVGNVAENVAAVNVALVAPAGTVTVGGTLTEPGSGLLRLTATPPAGAGLPRVTVPVADWPPGTLVGLTEKPVSAGRLGCTTRSLERVTPPPVTEIVTTVRAVTALVSTKKTPPSVEADMVMNSGTEATAGLLLVNRRI